MPVQMENVAIGLAQGMGNQPVAYEAAIDKKVLGIARSPTVRWQRSRTPNAQIRR